MIPKSGKGEGKVNNIDKYIGCILYIFFSLSVLSGCVTQEAISTAVVMPVTEKVIITSSPSITPTSPSTSTPIPATQTPVPSFTPTPTGTIPAGYVQYLTKSGDTLEALAAHFGTKVDDILCAEPEEACPEVEIPNRIITAGIDLLIPDRVRGQESVVVSPGNMILPDSEFIFSSPALDFDMQAYLEGTEGYLKIHRQYLMVNGWNSGAAVVEMVARENSVNPRLLLALLEYQCGCVLENPGTREELEPFLKATSVNYLRKDLWGQLNWAVRRMWVGYAGWRAGTLTDFTLKDGTVVRPDPELNAGTVAVQYFFAFLYDQEEWEKVVGEAGGFSSKFEDMFGNPWTREVEVFPANIVQPTLILPFEIGTTWSFTGGPHAAFDGNGPLAALDFAPAGAAPGCWESNDWVLAVADGVVVRVETGLVVLDLDGDGIEQTGWNVMYLHLEARDRVTLGTVVKTGDRLGHPSCEGGVANGTHVHLVRKYNGEWVAADSPLPFNLGGWVAENGESAYKGGLRRGEELRTACTCSWKEGWIIVGEK